MKIEFTIDEWAKIANALRVAATVNEQSFNNNEGDFWQAEAKMQRMLAVRIETEAGV